MPMRHVRFRLTGLADRGITREEHSRPASKVAGGTLIWIAAGAAAIYWLSGAKKGDVWPLPNLTPPTVEAPERLDFGDQQVGTRSGPRPATVRVTAGGDQPLRVGAPTLNDPQSLDFTIDKDNCTNATLRVGQACTVDVIFYPSSAGTHAALLLIPTSQQPREISLRGTAVPPPPVDGTTPDIAVQPGPHVHPPPAAGSPVPKPVRPGGQVTEPIPIYHPLPVYPEAARLAGTQDVVRLSGTITKDGHVLGLKRLSGDVELAAAAIEAVSRWQYKPATLDGKPIDDPLELAVKFTLVPASPAPPPAESATPSKGD